MKWQHIIIFIIIIKTITYCIAVIIIYPDFLSTIVTS